MILATPDIDEIPLNRIIINTLIDKNKIRPLFQSYWVNTFRIKLSELTRFERYYGEDPPRLYKITRVNKKVETTDIITEFNIPFGEFISGS